MIYINILLSIVALRILPNRKWQVTVGSRLFIITRQNLMKTILAAEILFVTICRKYTVGDDLRMYVRLFEAVKKYSWRDLLNSKFETGYLIFTWAIRELSNNAQFFIVVTGILTVGLYLREIFRKSYDVFLVMYLALTFGFFFFQFSILRQAIAMALFMIAVDKLENRKWIEYILLVLVAGTFHASAFVCLLLVFVSFLPWEAWAFSEDSLKGTINSLYDVQSRFSWVDKVLRPQLFFKQSLKERTALAEEVFLKRLFLARQNDTISYAISQILDKKGRLGADWLSRSCFISSRQLERLFHEYIGITPKKLCNLVRYQCLWNEILRNPGFRVQDAVYKYGYTDQSHLMREFKRYHTMDIKNALAYAQGIPLSAEGNVGNIQYFPQSL